jgi:hypothetical protein
MYEKVRKGTFTSQLARGTNMAGITDVQATPTHCGHCGGYHTAQCPRIKAIEYHPNGTIKRIEYHDPAPTPPTRGGFFEGSWRG